MRPIVVVIISAFIAACSGAGTDAETDIGGTDVMQLVELPTPDVSGGAALADALASRRSVRHFDTTPLTLEELSQLLWATQGVTSPTEQRTAPSAGGLYPLEVYLVTTDGRYLYDASNHQLQMLADTDPRQALAEAALDQESVREAPATYVITAVYDRTEKKYGERAERYVKIEVGHAAQNLLLQAVALDLGAVPVGAFHDDRVAAVMELQPNHEPLYLIPVGHPAG
jgi:SagB-type dehydrogenase family enzyme